MSIVKMFFHSTAWRVFEVSEEKKHTKMFCNNCHSSDNIELDWTFSDWVISRSTYYKTEHKKNLESNRILMFISNSDTTLIIFVVVAVVSTTAVGTAEASLPYQESFEQRATQASLQAQNWFLFHLSRPKSQIFSNRQRVNSLLTVISCSMRSWWPIRSSLWH